MTPAREFIGTQLVMHHTQVTKIFAIKRLAMLYSIQAVKRKSTSSLVGLFVQQWPQLIGRRVSFVKIQIAANNNDLNEENIDGKNITHATTMVIYQNRTFGPDPPPSPVEQRPKRRSLQATGTV